MKWAHLADPFAAVDTSNIEPDPPRTDAGDNRLLDGDDALWFARSRATTDDFSRMRRQRCLAGALISQVDAQTLLTRYPQIAQATKENLTIDIPLEDLPAWIDLLPRMQKAGKLRSLPFSNLNIHPGNPDFARIRAMVDEALRPAAMNLSIATAGVESLNAAVAAAIILYEARRQRCLKA